MDKNIQVPRVREETDILHPQCTQFPGIYVLIDHTGVIRHLNAPGKSALGIPGPVAGISFSGLIYEDDAAHTIEEIATRIISGQKWSGELGLINRQTKEVIWTMAVFFPLHDSDVRDSLTAGVLWDISAKKERSEILEHRKDVLELLYNISTAQPRTFRELCSIISGFLCDLLTVPCVEICRFDKQRKRDIITCMEGELHEGGIDARCPECSACGFVRMPASEEYHEYGEHDLKKIIDRVDCALLARFRYVLAVPVVDMGGERIGMICVMDSRQRTFKQEQIGQIKIFSRFLAHEHNAEIFKSRLEKNREMQVFRQIASGVAHEVRNPLNGIMATTEVLFQELEDPEKYRDFMTHIKLQVDHLTELMKELLDLSKPIQQHSLQPLVIAEACTGAVTLWEKGAAYPRHRVMVNCSGGLSNRAITLDPTKFNQIIMNILDNAAQHSPPSEVISMQVYAEKSWAVIRITDRGSGVDPVQAEKAFEPFYTTRKKGTGLGLSIVSHYVALHDGTVSLENNPDGPGCTVEIRLPGLSGDS